MRETGNISTFWICYNPPNNWESWIHGISITSGFCFLSLIWIIFPLDFSLQTVIQRTGFKRTNPVKMIISYLFILASAWFFCLMYWLCSHDMFNWIIWTLNVPHEFRHMVILRWELAPNWSQNTLLHLWVTYLNPNGICHAKITPSLVTKDKLKHRMEIRRRWAFSRQSLSVERV